MGARSSSAGAPGSGQAIVFSGRDGRIMQTMTPTSTEFAGVDVDLLGDADGDGYPDFAVGSLGRLQQGRAWVLAGAPCYAARRSYGIGHAGTLGVPRLDTDGDPVAGSSFRLLVGASQAQTAGGALVFGASAAMLPSPWGGTFLVNVTASLPVSIPAGGGALSLSAPAWLCGEVFVQGFMLDPGVIGGVAETPGLHLTVGQ